MAKRRALGRGLKALLPEENLDPGREVREIQVHRIDPSPSQPRKSFDPEAMAELAGSIRAHGMLQPVLVRSVGDSFELIVGERRWRAAMEAGLERIPALVMEPAEDELLVLRLVENIQREELNALEEAEAFRVLQDEHGMTQEEIASALGKSRVAVTNALRLLKLPRMVQDLLIGGRLTAGHARAILAASGSASRIELARRVLRHGLSVRQTEEAARRMGEVRTAVPPPSDPRTLSLLDLGERMGRSLGTRIRVVPRRKGARFIIDCAEDEEIEAIIDRMGLR